MFDFLVVHYELYTEAQLLKTRYHTILLSIRHVELCQ